MLKIIFIFCLLPPLIFANSNAPTGGNGTAASAAVVTRKFLHKNGLKEFTVQKNIKGTDCACACFCSLPNSPGAVAQMRQASPAMASHMDDGQFTRLTRHFEIEKEIRGNLCKCSCACADEPKEVFEGGQNSLDATPADEEQSSRNGVLVNRVEEADVGKEGANVPIATNPTSTAVLTGEGTTSTADEDQFTTVVTTIATTESSATPNSPEDTTETSIWMSSEKMLETSSSGNTSPRANEENLLTSQIPAEISSKIPETESTPSDEILPATSTAHADEETSTSTLKVDVLTTNTQKVLSSAASTSFEATSTESAIAEATTSIYDWTSPTVAETNEPQTVHLQAESSAFGQIATTVIYDTTSPESATSNSKPASEDISTEISILQATTSNGSIVESSKAYMTITGQQTENSSNSEDLSTKASSTESSVELEQFKVSTSPGHHHFDFAASSSSSPPDNSSNEQKMASSSSATAKPLETESSTQPESKANITSFPEEETSTFDPVFKARVAKLLGRLKEQLVQLRQMEQQTQVDRNGTTAEEALDQREQQQQQEDKLFFQIDQEVQNIGENGQEKPSERTTIANRADENKTTGNNLTTDNETLNFVHTSQTHTSMASPASPSSSPNPIWHGASTTASSAFITADGTEVEQEEVTDGATTSRNFTDESPVSASSVSSSAALPSTAATTEESTLSPLFKARVANLLNRLKDQLYRLREVQQQKTLQPGSNNSTTMTANDVSTISSSKSAFTTSPAVGHSSPTAAGHPFSRTEQMLEGLQQKLQRLQEKTGFSENATDSEKSHKNSSALTTATTIGKLNDTTSKTTKIATLTTTASASTATTTKPITLSATSTVSTPPITAGITPNTSVSSFTQTTPKTTTLASSAVGQQSSINSNGTTEEQEPGFAFVTEAPAEESANNVGKVEGNGASMKAEEEVIVLATNLTTTPEESVNVSVGLSSEQRQNSGTLEATHEHTTARPSPASIAKNSSATTQASSADQTPSQKTKTEEKLFPLPNDFLVDVPPRNVFKEGDEVEDQQLGRVILLPAPPQGRALFFPTHHPTSSMPNARGKSTEEKEEADEGHFTLVDAPVNGWASSVSIPEHIREEEATTLVQPPEQHWTRRPVMGDNENVQSTAIPVPIRHVEEDSGHEMIDEITDAPLAREGQTHHQRGRKKLVTPQAQNLIERLEQARKLREEQVKLEMMEAIRQEQLGNAEPDPHLTERRRQIEQRLLQLAQAERFHREMLERRKGQTEVNGEVEEENEEDVPVSSTASASPRHAPAVRCDPVRRFIRLFQIAEPRQWIDQNCQFARRHFPNASCTQIGALLNECLEKQEEEKEDDENGPI